MELVLLCVDIRHEMIGSITNRFILGVYHDPMVMQQVMSDFKEKNYDLVCTFWSRSFTLDRKEEIDIRYLIP